MSEGTYGKEARNGPVGPEIKTNGPDELYRAAAKLLTSVATALDSYTELQKRRFEYASQQTPQEQNKPFDEFQPGYFEDQFKRNQT